jgi:hypothetical protein
MSDIGYRIKVYSDFRYNVGLHSFRFDIGSSDIMMLWKKNRYKSPRPLIHGHKVVSNKNSFELAEMFESDADPSLLPPVESRRYSYFLKLGHIHIHKSWMV